MRRILLPVIGATFLINCAGTPPPATGEHPAREPAGACDASGVQDFIGRSATAAVGAQLLALTGAAQLRWVPPYTAVTMDFRPDRLTVSYDDDMAIERISCG